MKLFGFSSHSVAAFVVAAIVGLTTAAGTAHAGIMANGTIGYVPFGSAPTYVGPGGIETATSVALPAIEIVNQVNPMYLGSPNTFIGLVNLMDSVTVSPLSLFVVNGPISLPNYLVFSSSSGNRFEYDMTSIQWSSSPGSLSFLSLGTFRDTLAVFETAASSLSGAFTQTGGPNGPINASFTFATPPINRTHSPEPGSLVIALGMVAGFGYIRYRRRQK